MITENEIYDEEIAIITEKEFNETCEMYGLVPTKGLKNCFAFSGYEDGVWAKYSPTTKIAECWKGAWEACCTVEELRMEIESMIKYFKGRNKKIRMKMIEEL